MKKCFLLLLCCIVILSPGAINDYEELINTTLQACNAPVVLLNASYTNDVIGFRNGCMDAQGRCAADLSLAISLMRRMEWDEGCVGNDPCYQWHQSLVSNIIANVELPRGSWIMYAAGVEYVHGMNFGNHCSDGFTISTNMLMRLLVEPVDMGTTNFWNGMMLLQGCHGITIKEAFQLNAALEMAGQNRWTEVAVYTNSLPPLAIEKFLQGLE